MQGWSAYARVYARGSMSVGASRVSVPEVYS